MQVSVVKNKKGVTLVEVMIALVILLLVSLALMQTALVSINANMNNVLRDEAISIAEQRMTEARSMPYASLATDAIALGGTECPGVFATGLTVYRNFRNVISKEFCTNRTVTTLGVAKDATQVTVQVTWNWKGEAFTHTISSLIRRPN